MRQGRTDAWIAHQLEVSTSELREFRRRHELSAEEEADETDLRDEIEAQIEAATREEELAAEEERNAGSDPDEDDADDPDDGEGSDPSGSSEQGSDPSGSSESASDANGERRPRRRRRRRGGRGRSGRPGASMQASFDHGDEGYGLWLDAAIADDPIYSEHWAGHRPVEVTVEPDRIVIKRTGEADGDDGDDEPDDD